MTFDGIVNLTPHAITLLRVHDRPMLLPASGNVARLPYSVEPAGEVRNVALVTTAYGSVEGLPEPEEGTLYLVSAVVRAAVPDRTDVASPGDLVRDEEGVVVGCRHLIVNARRL